MREQLSLSATRESLGRISIKIQSLKPISLGHKRVSSAKPARDVKPYELYPSPARESITKLRENDLRQNYFGEIYSILDKNKFYPENSRRLNHQGSISVEFNLSRGGELLQIIDIQGEFSSLKNAVSELVKNTKFPKAPNELPGGYFRIKVELSFLQD